MRIADIDHVLEKLREYKRPWSEKDMLYEIDHAPFVDVVPVVRCQQCRHLRKETEYVYHCEELGRKVGLAEYCRWGERRECDGGEADS